MGIVDDHGVIREVPLEAIHGTSAHKDGSQRFKMIGGSQHDYWIRVYPPYDVIWFPSGETYEIHPPLKPARKGSKTPPKWVYVHNPLLFKGKQADGSAPE